MIKFIHFLAFNKVIMVIDFSEINHENDIFFKHINIVLQIIVKLGLNNFYIFIDLLNKDEIFNSDVGLMYNAQHFNNVIDSDYLNVLAQDFITLCKTTKELSHAVPLEQITLQPWKFMFNACHYFFIPLRINHNSIPEIVQFNNLLRWVNFIYLLPISKNFISLYQINYLEENSYFITLNSAKTNIEIKSKLRDQKNINDYCAHLYRSPKTKNRAVKFVRCYAIAIISISTDILKHYCPNIEEYIKINSVFKGQWLAFDDKLFNRQLYTLKMLTSRMMNC